MKEKLLPGTTEVGEFSGLTALVLSLFLNVTSVGEAWHHRAAQPWSQEFHWFRRNPFAPYIKVFEDVSWHFVFHAFYLWDSNRKQFLEICGPVPWKSVREFKVPEWAGKLFRLSSSKCLKPRISSTQRPHLLQKLEKVLSSDANRSMFSSSRFLSSCLPK